MKKQSSSSSLLRRYSPSVRAFLSLLIMAIVAGSILLYFGKAASCSVTISPGSNVATAFNNLNAGQTLCLHTGRYGDSTTSTRLNNNHGTATNPITLTTVPGEAPATLVGEFGVGFNNGSNASNNVTVSHLKFDLIKTDNGRVNARDGCTSTRVLGVNLNGNNVVFEYNDVSEANAPANVRDTIIGVQFVGRSSGIVIRYNKIHDFGGCYSYDHGIYMDHVDNGQIYGNWIWNGPCSYGSKPGDTSKGCGAGIQLYNDPANASVYNNVIDGTGLGMYTSGTGHNIHNNILINLRGHYYISGSLGAPVAYSGGSGSGYTFSNNIYYNSGSLCDICTAASASGNSTANPLFKNAAAHDYTLMPGSPAVSWGLWNGDLSNGTTIPPSKPGDASGDGKVDITDLSIVLSNYGKSSVVGDVSSPKDGKVDITDLSIVLSNYGK